MKSDSLVPIPVRSLWLCSILYVLTVLSGFSNVLGQVQNESGSMEGREGETITYVEFQNDIRLFAVMAAINVAGFDYELQGRQMSPVRQAVRADLEGISRELRTKLREFYLSHHTSDDAAAQSAYTSLALLIEGPPEFKILKDLPNIPAESREIISFERLLPEFYQKAELSRLWMKYSPEYERVLDAYRPVADTVIRRTLEYFRIPERVVLDSQIILIPDLLNFNGVVNARNQERTYYIVVGPSDEPTSRFIQIQHEYLHFLIDPMIEKNGGVILMKRELLELAHAQPNLREDFQGQFLLIVGESLIEAIQTRLHPPEDFEKNQVELFRRGLVFCPYFDRSLKRYEEQAQASFPSYLQKILEDITVDEIREDLKLIEKSESEILVRQELEQKEADKQKLERELAAEKVRMFNEAGRLMSEGQYSDAERLLRELLELEPENGNTYFYLGQIAGQRQNHEIAFAHYQKARELANTEEWVRAWAMVRMGRYLAHQERFEEARQMFEQVVGMDGDLKGARKDALDLIGKLPEN